MARSRANRFSSTGGGVGNMAKIILILVAVVLVGGVAFLATWDMPPPTTTVEKVIPNDRFK
jgi:hypothetical protein